MQNDTTRQLLDTLAKHVKETKAAYYAGTPGVTYEDMVGAATRLLRMRGIVERADGRKVTSAPTKSQIAILLRGGLF